MSVLMLLAALASAPVADRTAAPSVESSAVRLTLNNDRRFWPGDRARVQVEAADDGYLWVLQVDTEGRLRVLFPLDPDDDNYVQGGRRYELRGRGGRESFTTERERGEGFVYAAWQRQPFRFADVQVNGHWDYRALAPRALDQDPEPELNELLGRVSDARWEYDLLPYDVGGRGNRVDLVSAPVVVNRFYQAPVNFAGNNWWRNGWCSSHWYGSVGCDPYRSGFLGAGFGGGWGDPYGDGFWNPYGGWGQDPWGWNNYGFGGGFGGGWYGNGWNGGGFGGGWNGGGWNGGGFGGGGHGGGYIPPRGTNYEAKGRNRTWSGAPGPAASPVTFASGRDPRSRTGTSVPGPMPVGGPVREVDRTEGVGGRRWPLPAGFPVSRGSRPIGGQPGTGDDGTGGAGTDEPRPTPGRGRAAPDRGRGRDWDGAPPAGTPSRVPPAAEPGTGGERAPRDRSRNRDRDRDGEWTPAPRTPDRRAPVRPRDDSGEPRRAPESEPYIPRPMPRDDQPARQPTPRDESRAPRPTPRDAQPSRQRTPTDEPWAPRPTPRDEPRAAAPREEPREPARGRTWEPRTEPPREAPAPRREDPRAEPPRREGPRQEEPRREPPPRPEPQRQEPPRQEPQRQDPPRVEPRREEAPRSAPPRPRARDWKRGPN